MVSKCKHKNILFQVVDARHSATPNSVLAFWPFASVTQTCAPSAALTSTARRRSVVETCWSNAGWASDCWWPPPTWPAGASSFVTSRQRTSSFLSTAARSSHRRRRIGAARFTTSTCAPSCSTLTTNLLWTPLGRGTKSGKIYQFFKIRIYLNTLGFRYPD